MITEIVRPDVDSLYRVNGEYHETWTSAQLAAGDELQEAPDAYDIDRDAWDAYVMASLDLEELRDALNAYRTACKVYDDDEALEAHKLDMSDLPFWGPMIADTTSVVSFDEENLLMIDSEGQYYITAKGGKYDG